LKKREDKGWAGRSTRTRRGGGEWTIAQEQQKRPLILKKKASSPETNQCWAKGQSKHSRNRCPGSQDHNLRGRNKKGEKSAHPTQNSDMTRTWRKNLQEEGKYLVVARKVKRDTYHFRTERTSGRTNLYLLRKHAKSHTTNQEPD